MKRPKQLSPYFRPARFAASTAKNLNPTKTKSQLGKTSGSSKRPTEKSHNTPGRKSHFNFFS